MIYVACKIEEVTDFSTILSSSIKEGNYSLSVIIHCLSISSSLLKRKRQWIWNVLDENVPSHFIKGNHKASTNIDKEPSSTTQI